MYIALSDLPGIALLAGIVLPPAPRTAVRRAALIWKAAACLANAG